MELWFAWMQIAAHLRHACSRNTTYLWMLMVLIGMTVRTDYLGVSSYIRALGTKPKHYKRFLDFFHSNAINLDKLAHVWVAMTIKYFPGVLRVNGRLVLLGDGVKVAKCGKKMPGVKMLHQESEDNNKSEFIMGHSCQSIALLSQALGSFFAIPLISRIHEGFIFSKNENLTLLNKMVLLLENLGIKESYYFVADAYYASGTIINGLLANGNHLITRVKPNAVAYQKAAPPHKKTGAGRPRLYGTKLHLKRLFDYVNQFIVIDSPVYGEKNVKIKYISTVLLWRPVGIKVMFVAVMHPTRGKILLLNTDLSLSPVEVIRLYALRFKIEHTFKQSIHILGTYTYRFWMKDMQPTKRGDLDNNLYEKETTYQTQVKRKLAAYHCHIQLGIIAQGLLQYLSCVHSKSIWNSFGSWLRTVRDHVPPSELVTSMALRNTLPKFLLDDGNNTILKKFLIDKIDIERHEGLRLVA